MKEKLVAYMKVALQERMGSIRSQHSWFTQDNFSRSFVCKYCCKRIFWWSTINHGSVWCIFNVNQQMRTACSYLLFFFLFMCFMFFVFLCLCVVVFVCLYVQENRRIEEQKNRRIGEQENQNRQLVERSEPITKVNSKQMKWQKKEI